MDSGELVSVTQNRKLRNGIDYMFLETSLGRSSIGYRHSLEIK
jgi:hypothetical protein